MTQSGIRQTTWPFDPLNHILIHSKYFPDSDDQIWKNFVFNEPMTSKVQLSCMLMHR